jgi:hypothetical protein
MDLQLQTAVYSITCFVLFVYDMYDIETQIVLLCVHSIVDLNPFVVLNFAIRCACWILVYYRKEYHLL